MSTLTDLCDLDLPWLSLGRLDNDEKAIALQLIAFCAEKAYRRGFHQGWNAQYSSEPFKDVANWRYGHTLHECEPPEMTGAATLALCRLEMECGAEVRHVFGTIGER